MGWKNWPAWVKGGVIGFFSVFLLILIIRFFLNSVSALGDSPGPLYLLLGKVYFIIYFIPGTLLLKIPFMGLLGYFNFFGELLTIFICSLFYFLIGALIGWIVGKIKSKNQLNSQQILTQ